MKKKIAIIVAASMLFGGAVSAASLWGSYKGNQIIRLTVNGKPVTVSDVPAVSLNSRTMIPIYLLKQAGISYSWDNKSQTVDITKSQSSAASTSSPAQLTKNITKFGGGGVTITSNGFSTIATTFFRTVSGFNNDWVSIFGIFINLASFQTDTLQVIYTDNSGNTIGTVSVATADMNSYLAQKLTPDQLSQKFIYTGSLAGSSTSTSSSPVATASFPELYSNDGKTYLGKITSNTFDKNSIFNEFGTYGSEFSTSSIWDEFGDYGSQFSSTSAFNKLATEPPIIILDGKIIGYLTLNTTIKNGISPNSLLDWAKKNGY